MDIEQPLLQYKIKFGTKKVDGGKRKINLEYYHTQKNKKNKQEKGNIFKIFTPKRTTSTFSYIFLGLGI